MESLESSNSLESLLAGYVLGDLTPEEVAKVKQILENSPDLAVEVERLQSTLALLPLSLPTNALPPKDLPSRILQAAQNDVFDQTRASTPFPNPFGKHLRQLAIALGGLATLAIAALGIQNYQLQLKLASVRDENRQLQQELISAQTSLNQLHQAKTAAMSQKLSQYQQVVNLLGEPNSRFLTLKGTHSKSASSGSLLIAPKSEAAILVLQNVDPLPQGKVYRMWATINGEKVSCTDFQPNNRGEVFLKIPLDQWGSATEVTVTVEPEQEIPQPVGEMVMTGS